MQLKGGVAAWALLILGFVVLPATAFASPRLETSLGTVVPAGTALKAQNVGENLWTNSLGTQACPKGELTGKVIGNSGTKIEITVESLIFSGTEFSSACTTPISQKFRPTALTAWCLQSTSLGAWTIKGSACGSLPTPVKMIKDIYEWRETEPEVLQFDLVGECKYERKELTGTNNTGTAPLTLKTTSGQNFIRTSGIISLLCPELESLDLTFKLQTSAGGELKVV
jgi:hypothetical protein